MFDFSEWLTAGIIDGYKKGYTPFSRVTELTANYMLKSLITEEQVEEIATACPAPVYDEGVVEVGEQTEA